MNFTELSRVVNYMRQQVKTARLDRVRIDVYENHMVSANELVVSWIHYTCGGYTINKNVLRRRYLVSNFELAQMTRNQLYEAVVSHLWQMVYDVSMEGEQHDRTCNPSS